MDDRTSRYTLPLPIKLGLIGAAGAAAAYIARQRRCMDFCGKTIVITGGSRGLGLELARGFSAEGANIVLLARDRDQLTEAERELRRNGVRVVSMSCDVANQKEVRNAIASITAELGIDVLINNAGIIQVGPYEHMQPQDFADAMDTHFWGPLYLIQEALPYMKRQGGGRIVNIASIAGKIAVPHLLPYVASKFALVGFSEGLRAELVKDGIYVTTVSPGLMRTGSHVNALFKGQHKKRIRAVQYRQCLSGAFRELRSRRAPDHRGVPLWRWAAGHRSAGALGALAPRPGSQLCRRSVKYDWPRAARTGADRWRSCPPRLAKPLGIPAAVTDAAGRSRHHPQSRKIAVDAELMKQFGPSAEDTKK